MSSSRSSSLTPCGARAGRCGQPVRCGGAGRRRGGSHLFGVARSCLLHGGCLTGVLVQKVASGTVMRRTQKLRAGGAGGGAGCAGVRGRPWVSLTKDLGTVFAESGPVPRFGANSASERAQRAGCGAGRAGGSGPPPTGSTHPSTRRGACQILGRGVLHEPASSRSAARRRSETRQKH